MHVHDNIPYYLTMSSILLNNNNILVTTYLSTKYPYLSLCSILMCFCWGEHPLQYVPTILYNKFPQILLFLYFTLSSGEWVGLRNDTISKIVGLRFQTVPNEQFYYISRCFVPTLRIEKQ